ncbi:hypothetical protein D3C73_945160 [compost metagenome]
MESGGPCKIAVLDRAINARRNIRREICARRNGAVTAQKQRIQQMIVIAAEDAEFGMRALHDIDHVSQMRHRIDRILKADDIGMCIDQPLDEGGIEVLACKSREVIEQHRQFDRVGDCGEVTEQVFFRHLPVVGIDGHDAAGADRLGVPAECYCFARIGAAGADQHRHPAGGVTDDKFGNRQTLLMGHL